MSSSNDRAFGAESGTGSGGLGSEILVAAIVFFAMAVVFVVFIYIYVRWNWGPGSEARRAHLHRVLFGHGPDADAPPARPRGLDPSVLEKLPVSLHATSDGALECAVCLSEVSDGEKVRVLPKCKHGFHVQCIDMWLHSHSTCPLCRDPLAGEHCGGVSTEGYTSGAPALPTDVMFWGTEDQVLTTATREPAVQQLVIDIPRRAMEETPATTSSAASPPLPASSGGATPSLGRLRSFTRLFSMGRWAAAAGTSREGDVEQGEAATAGGKTPRQS